jgi:3-hydroxybutyryl-CoA dehydrogenase
VSAWPQRAAVIGAGTMGRGFAQLLALAGVDCAVGDASLDAAAVARERAIAEAGAFAQAGLMPGDAAERVDDFDSPGPGRAHDGPLPA